VDRTDSIKTIHIIHGAPRAATGILGFCWYESGKIPTRSENMPTLGIDRRKAAKPEGDRQDAETRRRRRAPCACHGHLFRHLVGKLYLEDPPQEIETVRQVLGHETNVTTERRYDTPS
jgi:integrase